MDCFIRPVSSWKQQVQTLYVLGTDDLFHPHVCTLCLSISRYRWLVNMWTAYGGRKDLAAISLQRQTMKVTYKFVVFSLLKTDQ